MDKLVSQGYETMLVWVLHGNSSYKFYESIGGERKGEKYMTIDETSYKAIAYDWDNLI